MIFAKMPANYQNERDFDHQISKILSFGYYHSYLKYMT